MAEKSYSRAVTVLVGMLAAAVVATLVMAIPAWAASNEDQTAAQEDNGQTDLPINAQIVGGTDVPNGKYPFMAAIFEKVGEGPPWFYGHICGGTLIDPDSVLTAAHCVTEGQFASDLRVAVGRTVLSNNNQGYVRNVNRIYIHPYYDSETQKNDVAVLKLNSRVNLPWILIPRSTDNRFEEHGRSLRVAGWGETFTEEGTDRMKETQVPVLSDYWAEQFYGDAFFPTVMVAAGKEGKDTCFGDSGGPLFEKVQVRVNGRWHTYYYQVGITSFSFGESCGQAGYVGAYTEVNNPGIRSFILTNAAK